MALNTETDMYYYNVRLPSSVQEGGIRSYITHNDVGQAPVYDRPAIVCRNRFRKIQNFDVFICRSTVTTPFIFRWLRTLPTLLYASFYPAVSAAAAAHSCFPFQHSEHVSRTLQNWVIKTCLPLSIIKIAAPDTLGNHYPYADPCNRGAGWLGDCQAPQYRPLALLRPPALVSSPHSHSNSKSSACSQKLRHRPDPRDMWVLNAHSPVKMA